MLNIKKLGASINSNLMAYGRLKWNVAEHFAKQFTTNSFMQGMIMGLFYSIAPINFFIILTILNK